MWESATLRGRLGPNGAFQGATQIDRLRQRGTKGKRRLALQQHALGMEALRELQAQRGRVTPEAHQCIFGILALELEPMDPRL